MSKQLSLNKIVLLCLMMLALQFVAIPGHAQEKRTCTKFWANFIGLEFALTNCLPTPEFNAWVKEERERLAGERQQQPITPKEEISAPSNATTISATGAKTCYICRPDYVPGEPVEGNRTLGQIIQINYGLLQGADLQLMADLDLYCRKFKVVNEKSHLTLKSRLIEPMTKDARNGDVTPFFVEAGCEPSYIAQTRSPMSHLTSEIPEAYLKAFETVRQYFDGVKKPESFTKMVNARNTRGHTTLDYVEYLLENQKYDDADKVFLNTYRAYLCVNGGRYHTYTSSKSCVAKADFNAGDGFSFLCKRVPRSGLECRQGGPGTRLDRDFVGQVRTDGVHPRVVEFGFRGKLDLDDETSALKEMRAKLRIFSRYDDFDDWLQKSPEPEEVWELINDSKGRGAKTVALVQRRITDKGEVFLKVIEVR